MMERFGPGCLARHLGGWARDGEGVPGARFAEAVVVRVGEESGASALECKDVVGRRVFDDWLVFTAGFWLGCFLLEYLAMRWAFANSIGSLPCSDLDSPATTGWVTNGLHP